MLQASDRLCHALSQHGQVDVGHAELCSRGRQAGHRYALCPCPRDIGRRSWRDRPAGRSHRPGQGGIGLLSDERKRVVACPQRPIAAAATMLWPRVVERSLEPLASRPAPTVRPLRRAAADSAARRHRTDDATGSGCSSMRSTSVPDRDHGYCIDDNARALMVAGPAATIDQSAALATIYAAFVQHGWNPDRRRFRNFMGYDRQLARACGSEDSNGRTLWALGMTAARASSPAVRDWALQLFEEAAATPTSWLHHGPRRSPRLAGTSCCRRGPITIWHAGCCEQSGGAADAAPLPLCARGMGLVRARPRL